jgi:methionine-R-sulfoxide reductase
MTELEKAKTDQEWRSLLSPERYAVLRQAATEPAFTGALLDMEDDGTFICGGCRTALFESDSKFNSGCGWPSFDRSSGPVVEHEDRSHGMVRTEILCGACGGHLGHVFDDGPTETGLRYCVNSLSLEFRSTTD